MSHVLTSDRLHVLRDRAAMLSCIRSFFAVRGVEEVDVPLLSERASIDAHIDLVTAQCMGKECFLHSSPEYGMKRLLSEGIGDIYQLSHVFRDGERGARHNPEFLMVEWYRLGFSLEEMIEESADFVRLFFDDLDVECARLSYREAFMHYVGHYPSEIEERDWLFSTEIEPHLGAGSITAIVDFPPEQAALAQLKWQEGELVAERFELFYRGYELANGYHELGNALEQKQRLIEGNVQRDNLGKRTYPMDDKLLDALSKGFPDCCGVAIGVDRLMMLRHESKSIDKVIPFPWGES